MPFFNFGFTQFELAEFDLSIPMRSKTVRPRVVKDDDSFNRFSYVWSRPRVEKKVSPSPRPAPPTPRERFRSSLLKRYAGRPLVFYFAHSRFLGDSKSRVVAPFYKEIFEILKKDALKASRYQRRRAPAEKKKLVFPSNRYTLLENEDSPDCEEWEDEDVEFTPRVKRSTPRDQAFIGPRNLPACPKERDGKLLLKLKMVLTHLEGVRTGRRDWCRLRIVHLLSRYALLSEKDVVPQMDEEIVVDKKSNTTTMNTTGQEVIQPIPTVISDFWTKASTSDSLHRYDEFCDRWHVLSNLIWSSDDKRDKVLLDVPLPFQFLKDNAKSPNFVPFAQYAYWKGDISIRIHLNTTMYNVGSLIVSWYYGASFDSNKSLRLYRPACVQLPHAMINASDSNDVVLNIPYRSYKSMLSMYKKESDVHFAELGNLRLVVFNPLLLSSVDTTTSVSITTYVSFPNSQFTGLIPRDDTQFTVIQPQMFPLIKAKKIVNFASDAMDMFIPDPNRDNPPIVERPMSVAPIATGNWASGNNDIDLLNTLRLEPSGQTPHPVGSSTSKDEMDIRSVVSQWGFLTTLDWKVDSVVGTLLTTINASPIQTIYDDYDIAFGTLSRKCNIYTPVHNVANMFSLWRGELELKVEIISSAFQVGSLIIGYCPRRNYKLTSKNSLSLIKSMYNCTIDLETQSSFVFKIPYIADKPWWPVTAKIDDNNVRSRIDPPGFVYVAVLNQLIAAKSLVPTTCYINLYLRASDSFEVSLLSNPRIGLSFDITSSKQSIIHTVVGPSYAKEFAVGVWRYTGDAPIVFRYGSGSDHITQFLNLKPNVVYEATEGFGSVIAISYKRPVLHAKLNYDIHSGIPKYLVRFIVNGDRDTYSYGAPFCTKDEAHNFINHNPADIYANSNLAWLLRYNANDYIKLLDDASGVVWTVLYEDVVPQMDNDLILDTASSSLVSTSAGHMTFGERVTSLKSICRRYQHYKSISYTPDKLDSFGNLSKGVLIPLKPDGLDIDQTTFMENLRRDGVIGYVCSAYRFFRGSLRFKFVFRSDIQGMVYLQHVFDQELADNDYLIEQPSVNTSRMLQPGYAIVAQNLNLNNVVSFETPFYLPTNLGLLQNPIEGIGKIESVVKSLGYIYMHYQSSPSSMVGKTFVDIFYSFGDDMSLSCFVGFPPVFEISTLEDQWKPKKKEDSFEIIEPQMGLFNNKYSAPTISPEELTNIIDLLRNYINLLHTPLPNLEGSKDAALNRVVVQFTAVTSDSTFGAFVGHFLPAKLDTRLKVDRMLVRDPKDLYNYLYRKYKENASVVVSDHFVKQHPDSIKAKIEWNNKSFMEKLDSKLDEKVSNFSKSVVKDSKEAVSEVLEKQDAGIWDYIKSIAEIVGGDVKHLLMSSFTHIMHVLISPSLSTFAVAIIGVLITLGLICTSMVTKLISLMTTMYKDVFELMKKWSTPSSSVSATPTKTEIGGASGADVVAQAGPEKLELSSTDKATLLATLVGGITGIVAHGHKISTRNIPDFTSGLFKGITEVSRGCNFLTVFFKNNLEMFQKILRYVTNKLFPRRAFQLTIEDEEEYMKAWFEDVRELNDPRNLDAVMHDPAWNVRVYQAAVVAEAYKLKFLSSDVRPNPLLISTCNKIIELRDKLASEKISPPVRFEPWVLCISGATAIGKSHMADSLADTLLESINYRSYSEKVYTRTPGNPYWNQLRSQPVLLYDDFCQVATPEARAMDMSELFCLKSKAVFNPPQAAIEDKHIRYNPLVVMLLCNRPYMHIAQVTDQNAWMRRRDLIINARIVPRFAHLHVRDIPSEITKAYGHLEFDIYRSSVSENEGFSHTNLTYAELQDILRTRFNNFYQQELIHYNARLAASTRFMPDRDEAIENTIERYNKHLEIINAQNKIQDAEIIFNGQTYKDNMLPAFLRDRHVEPQMNGEVCKHSLMKRDWEFTDDITELQQNYGSLADCVGITGKVSAFYDANEISQWVTAEPCTDVSCYWKLENQKNYHAIMKNWKLAHKPIFEKQKTLIDEGMSDICIPIYFINSAPSTSTMDYDKKMNRLHAELFSDKSQHRIEIVKEAEKKGWKYHVLKAGKWILRQVIKIVGFALFITAAHGLATYIGNKLNIVPFDDESRAVVHDYVKGTGDARLNVNISDKVRNFFNIQPKNCQGQMAYDLKVPSAAKQAILPKLAISPQMAVDVESTLISKLNRNTFFLTMHKSSGTTRTFRCLGICGRRAIILDHYYYEYRKDDVVYLTVKYLNVEHVIDRNSLCHSTVENSAFVCLELPSNMNSFKDIRKLFIKSSQSSAIPTTCKIFESTQQYNMLVHNLPLSFRKTLSIPNDGHAATNLELVYEYPLSQAGLCGSVVATTGNMSNPIIGIHVAGTRDGKYGFAEPICYETIESMIGNLSEVGVVDCVEPQLGPIDKSRLKFEFNVNVLGVVDSSLAHHQPGSSTIVPTLCSGEITEVTYDIPVLHSKDARIMDNPFSPMLVGCSYHCLTPVPFNNIILKRAFDYYNGLILSSVKPLRPNVGVLSRSQAIVGIHNLEHYDPMEFSTSEGFPFVKDRPKGCGDKRWLFDLEAIPEGWKLNGINSKLVNVLDCKQTMRQRGIVPDTIFTDCLKDQKLPLEKVLIPGKTRIFSISPVDFTIQCRQYFMDFAVAYQEARFDADHAIGIDCNSIEWTVLANRLLSVSNNIVVADYTKFGPTLMASCVHYAFEIMINWYKFYAGEDEDAERIRRVMCEESKFAKHLMLNLVYRVGCGSPSGHPLTTILNSIVNSLYVLYAFLSCGFTTKEYVDNVKLITYGDDLIMSVSDSCISSFNCDVMSRIFSKYGIKLTDASKTGDVVMCRQLLDKDVTFLKRRFIPHSFRRGIFLAQLDIRSVLEVCNWTFKSIDLQTKSKESCYAMLENAYGAGEEFYENLRAKVAVWWRKHNYNFVAPSWHEVDERCFGIGSVR